MSGGAFLATVGIGVAIGLTLAGWSPTANRAGRRIADFIRWMAEGEPHEIRYGRTIPEPPRVRRIPARPRPYDWETES